MRKLFFMFNGPHILEEELEYLPLCESGSLITNR
jgi:hypothetical protein